MMISFEFYQANIHHPLLCCCSRSGVEEEYTEQDQLLREVLEKWNEKAVHKERKEAEKRSAASGREEVLRLRAEAVAMYKKRKAGDDAVEEEPSEDREEVDASQGGGKQRRLDLNKSINRRLQQKDEELELRRRELELAQEKRKEEAEERKLFMAMMKIQAGL